METLRALAEHGIIRENTPLETESGQVSVAGKIEGLTFGQATVSPPVPVVITVQQPTNSVEPQKTQGCIGCFVILVTLLLLFAIASIFNSSPKKENDIVNKPKETREDKEIIALCQTRIVDFLKRQKIDIGYWDSLDIGGSIRVIGTLPDGTRVLHVYWKKSEGYWFDIKLSYNKNTGYVILYLQHNGKEFEQYRNVVL